MSEPTLVHALAAVGVAAIVMAQEAGPGAFVRERVLRPVLLVAGAAVRRRRVNGVLDCTVCASVWAGVLVGVADGVGALGGLMAGLGPAGFVWSVKAGARGGLGTGLGVARSVWCGSTGR